MGQDRCILYQYVRHRAKMARRRARPGRLAGRLNCPVLGTLKAEALVGPALARILVRRSAHSSAHCPPTVFVSQM